MSGLTHIGKAGEAHMVDVGNKEITSREATACGYIKMQMETVTLVREGNAKKGDVLATARIAGIMAAKKTSDLIPLCHPIGLSKVIVDLEIDEDLPGIRVKATAGVAGQTGVEMEALHACSVACLTIYDMAKAIDKAMIITNIQLVKKSGGQSGNWQRNQ